MKLVRDKNHALYPQFQYRRAATAEEHLAFLRAKTAEELAEFLLASTRTQQLEELGDLLDVIYAIENLLEINQDDLARRVDKIQRVGAFLGGWIMMWPHDVPAVDPDGEVMG